MELQFDYENGEIQLTEFKDSFLKELTLKNLINNNLIGEKVTVT